jgi:hypothetical protein
MSGSRRRSFPLTVSRLESLYSDRLTTTLRRLKGWQQSSVCSYSFAPPEVRPLTTNFWQTRNMTVIGTPLKTANAAKRPQSF